MDAILLERGDSIAVLDNLMAHVREGVGRVGIVGGEAGVGKTSLIERFVERHRGAVDVFWGACDALSTPRALGPLYDIALHSNARPQTLLEELADRATLFGAFLEDLRRSHRPSIVVFEDIHWADEATLDLIKFLGRRIQHTPALFILTYRDDEVGADHPLTAVFGDLPTRSLARVRLQPLSPAAVAVLAGNASLPTEGVERLYATTGGNPFFVTEALASTSPGVPVTVRDAVLVRTARLSPAARAALDLASVVPRQIEHWIVEAVSGADLSGFDECVAAGMLRQESDAVVFRHELARLAVQSALPASRLRGLNAQVLTALLQAPEERVDVARLVHHAAQAGDRAHVLQFAPLAASQAATQGAHREAASQYRTALRFADEGDAATCAELLEGVAYECYLTSQMAEVLQARESALDLWRRLGRTEMVGQALRWLSRLHWFLGHDHEADQYADRAVELLSTLPPGKELAMAYSNRSQVYMLDENGENAVLWGSRAITLAEEIGDVETLSHALNNVGTAMMLSQDAGGEAYLLRSLDIARAHGLDEHVARAYTNLVEQPIIANDHARAERYLADGIDYCVERDLDSWGLYMRAWRARERLNQGDWASADEEAIRVLKHHTLPGAIRMPALIALGWLRVRRGDPGAAAMLDEARDIALPTGELQRIAPVMSARAEAAWLRGDLALCASEARIGFDLAKVHVNSWPHAQLAYWLWRAGVTPKPLPRVPTPFAMQTAGDWQAAAAEWERLGCPYERALALLDGDEPAQRTALDIFERLGAPPALEIARRQLRESGARGLPRGPRPATRANPVGLTNRQLEILELLAAGLRNAEIAERLSASPKTIDHHVSAVLAKLGVRSRAEAVAAALELGLSVRRDTSIR